MCFRPLRDNNRVFHGLRKSAVVFLLEAGCADAEVSAIAGQSRANGRALRQAGESKEAGGGRGPQMGKRGSGTYGERIRAEFVKHRSADCKTRRLFFFVRLSLDLNGAPGKIRTRDPQIRSLVSMDFP